LSDNFKIEIGRDALGRLLKLWSLSLNRKLRHKKKSVIKVILEGLADRVNLLIRTKITAPLQALSTDITEIIYNNGKNKAYLAVHKDVHGQMVYGWALGLTMETNLVLTSLRQATLTIKKLIGKIPKGLLGHSDQGSQYTSYEYVETALEMGLILSYSSPGTPTENPGQESFFGRFKDENKDLFLEIESFEELKKLISKRISYYNKKRLHTSLKLQSPKKFTMNFIKNFPK
jgi:putative transposase